MGRLEAAEIDTLLAASPWRREGESIVREWQRRDFADAIAFVNSVAALAEAANHHPDILVHAYRRVRLELCTHSAGGLTGADFALAQAVDALG